MAKLSCYDKYSIDEIASALNLSKKLANGIRKHFGEPLSLIDLKQIKRKDFYQCKGLGIKSWAEFRNAVANIQIPNESVKLIEKTNPTKIVVEIDLSKPFSDVINTLSEVIEDMR
ncbi:MAG: hypothetical protein R6V41_06395 [Desulfobacteraceae bacterium]